VSSRPGPRAFGARGIAGWKFGTIVVPILFLSSVSPNTSLSSTVSVKGWGDPVAVILREVTPGSTQQHFEYRTLWRSCTMETHVFLAERVKTTQLYGGSPTSWS
jgi:hypothetical protein